MSALTLVQGTDASVYVDTNFVTRAAKRVETGDVVERVPVIPIPSGGRFSLFRTTKSEHLTAMAYMWDKEADVAVMGMGHAALYGFSDDKPNVTPIPDLADSRFLLMTATRPIAPGEVLLRKPQFLGMEPYVLPNKMVDDDVPTERYPIRVARAEYGIGVYATRDITEGEVIEVCPALVVEADDKMRVSRTGLGRYWYNWDGRRSESGRYVTAGVALGYGGIYNHSRTPNMVEKANASTATVTFWAARDVKAGEELTHDYGWPNSDDRFKV